MSLKRFKKIISAVLCLDLIFQSFLPLLTIPVYASEDLVVSEFAASDSAIVFETKTPPEPTAVLTPEPTVELTLEPTLEPGIVPEVILEPTQAPSTWTFENVELGREYLAPQNSGVKLIFTKLPTPAGNLKIEEITLTTEQIHQTGSLSDKAYDITSDMADGSFSYDLVLPIPESSKGEEIGVKFAEEISQIGGAEKVENTLATTDASVLVRSLNHFTIFVVVNVVLPTTINVSSLEASWTAAGGGGVFSAYIGPPAYGYVSPGSTSLYDGRESGIIKAGLEVDPGSGNYEDEGLFGFKPTTTINTFAAEALTYDVTNQEGTNPVWMTIEIDTGVLNDRSDNTSYQFVPATNPAGWHTVDAGAGQWQKWADNVGTVTGPLMSLSDVAAANTGLNVVRAYLRLGMGNSYNGTGLGTIAWIDKITIGDLTYDFVVVGSCSGASVTPPIGTTACYQTIQEAIAAAVSGDTINVAAGTYTEVGQIVIDKDLTIVGADKLTTIVKPAQDTGNSGDARGWILVNSGKNFNLKNLTLDGETKLVNIGILAHGPGIIDNIIVKNMGYNPSGPDYAGRGIAFYDADMTVTNSLIQNYGRIGLYINGVNTALIEGNTIEGKGAGDHLDYAVEVEGGATAEIKGNIISNNQGVASVDGSISAGILATTYWASGTKVKLINNSIHDNSYGVALGYNNDTTSVLQFDGNTFASNTYDFDNYTVNSVDARNNTWSVADQDNFDQIEAKINHYCFGSEYVHGVCSGSDDYSTGFGSVRYKNIGTPSNLGWNVGSKSTTPNELPLDLACPTDATYINENSVAQNWSAVAGTNIKYRREVIWPSNAVGYYGAGSNTYTPFSTFGSSVGIEGLWKTRVLAYVDANNNNNPDATEETSAWSNQCKITLDKTAPSSPINGLPNGTSLTTNNFDFTWDNSSDASSVTYEFQSSLNPAAVGGVLTTGLWKSGTLATAMIHSSGAPDGVWYWQVRATDAAGNTSAWSNIWNVTLDTVDPSVDLVFPTPGSTATSFQAVFGENVVQSQAEDPANYFLTNWPGAGGSGDLAGDATIAYDSVTKTATISLTNPGWYISPEQLWGVQNIHDLAGNLQQPSPYSEYSTSLVKPVTTDTGTDANWHNTSVTVNLVCSDVDGSGCKTTYYTTDGSTPTTTSPTGNSVTLTTDGTYTIKYFSVDNAGNTEDVKTASNVVKIDKTLPGVPTITSPSAEQYFNTSPILNQWSVITDTSGINQYKVEYVYDDGHTFSGAPYRNTTTNYRNHSPGITEQGGVTIRVRAEDNAGNVSDWSDPVHYVYDATAPVVTSLTSDGATYNLASADPTVKITFNEAMAIAPSVEVHSVGSPQTVTDCADSDAKTFCFNYALSLEEASHTIYISAAADLAGNVMTLDTAHTFSVDRIAPTLSDQTVFSGWYNTSVTSSFSYSDSNGMASGSNPTCDITTQGLNQTCSLTPNACDINGNCNTTEVTSNGADIDLTNPDSTITSPSNSGSDSTIYLNSWTGSILGTATDALSGVAGVKVSIQNGSGQYFDGSTFVDSGTELLLDTTYSAGDWEYIGLTSPAEDSYTIRSHALDVAGNMESTYSLTIILDKTIPQVALTINPTAADASNGWYKTQPEVTLTATDTNIDKIEYQWDSQTGLWTTYSAPFKPETEGAHVLYYRAHDLADNYSEVGVKNIKWDKTDLTDGPLNLSVSPNPTSGTTSVVKWSAAQDNLGIDKYEVKWWLKDGDKSYTDSVGSEVREHTVNNLTEGIWVVQVTAFDASGNSKSASNDLTVDRTGPAAPTLTVLGTSVGSVSLSWSKITDANNYVIWYGTNSGVYQYGANVGDTQAYVVQGLGAGSYYFIVKAVDPSGNQSGNSNEVSTGAIVGAPGAVVGQPAEGFSPEVQGVNIEATPSGSLTDEAIPTVLGDSTADNKNWLNWWWLLLLLPIYLIGRYFYKKNN